MSVCVDALPRNIFFVPTAAFFGYLDSICPLRQVVDVGAGVGDLSAKLAKRGYKVLAIDILSRERSRYAVADLDATKLTFPETALPIMGRPCHGGWVQAAIENALRTTPTFLYMGLDRNIETDLGWAFGKLRLDFQAFEAGEEGEFVVKIFKRDGQNTP